MKVFRSSAADDAMDFAQKEGTAGSLNDRKKRIAMIAGAGLLIYAVLLLFILKPFKQTGSSNNSAAGASLAPTISVFPTPTATPEPTPTPTPAPTPDINKLAGYYAVSAPKYYNEYGFSTNSYKYTDRELMMLAKVIHAEARGESREGQIAVGNVVMNRVLLKGYFGDTIEAVVTARNQFCYNPDTVPNASSVAAATAVLNRETWVVTQHTYYFRTGGEVGVNWGSHKFYKRIGSHNFYTHMYYGRNRNGVVPAELYDRLYKWPQMGCKPEERVIRIQYMLDKLGYKIENVDGYFGKSTKDALMLFQKSKGLKADGIAGASTLRALIKAFGIGDYCLKYV
jgi:hypothetical protein